MVNSNWKVDSVINEFNVSKKIIRKKIVDKVKLKYAPEISFFFDETIQTGSNKVILIEL